MSLRHQLIAIFSTTVAYLRTDSTPNDPLDRMFPKQNVQCGYRQTLKLEAVQVRKQTEGWRENVANTELR